MGLGHKFLFKIFVLNKIFTLKWHYKDRVRAINKMEIRPEVINAVEQTLTRGLARGKF